METVLAFLVGGLFAAGIYSLLRRSVVKLIIGLLLVSQACNLLILTAAGLTRGQPAIINQSTSVYADPLPQALILTAIVIGFGVVAFTLVLIHQVYRVVGSDDLDEMRGTD
jgi:multicomponent Na+:H+ antiporter subunit C